VLGWASPFRNVGKGKEVCSCRWKAKELKFKKNKKNTVYDYDVSGGERKS
jgi:hypothetical protein